MIVYEYCLSSHLRTDMKDDSPRCNSVAGMKSGNMKTGEAITTQSYG